MMFSEDAADRLSQVISTFDSAIYGLRDSDVPQIVDISGRSVARIAPGPNQELMTGLNSDLFNIPGITGFAMIQVPEVSPPQYGALIVIDAGRILTYPKEEVQADLVRTLGIADQVPVNGFERRLHTVAGDALDLQKLWLAAHPTKLHLLDPDRTGREALIRKILGEKRYFADTGFADWQQAVDGFLGDRQFRAYHGKFRLLRDNRHHFAATREQAIEFAYDQAMMYAGDTYLTLSADIRARASAMAMASTILTMNPNSAVM
jgi:hypothetical protein